MFSNAWSGSATSPIAAAGFSKIVSSAPASRSPEPLDRHSEPVGSRAEPAPRNDLTRSWPSHPRRRTLQKTIGVDVDLDAGGAGGADAREPIAQDRLEPH